MPKLKKKKTLEKWQIFKYCETGKLKCPYDCLYEDKKLETFNDNENK